MSSAADRRKSFEFEWSARGVGKLARDALQALLDDEGLLRAAAIAYYSLLSIFPLLLVVVSVAAFFVQPEWAVEQITRLLGDFLPQGVPTLEEIVKEAVEQRREVGIFSFLGLAWSGTQAFGAVARGLNKAYGSDKEYGLKRRMLAQLLMTLALGSLFVVALLSRNALRLLGSRAGYLPSAATPLGSALIEGVAALMLLATFGLIYRYVPRDRVPWRAAGVGAVVALVLFMLARPVFLHYVRTLADYSLVYGPLAVGVILIFWAWIVGVILLYGGEITARVAGDAAPADAD